MSTPETPEIPDKPDRKPTPFSPLSPESRQKIDAAYRSLHGTAKKTVKEVHRRLPRPDLRDMTPSQKKNFALFASLMVLVLALSAGAAFLLTLRGSERVMVPDVRGMDLAESLVRLQERELYPRLSLRFTDNPADRNTVLEQTPVPGSIVKAGRRVHLTVSRGAVLDKIESYLGKDLEEVKLHLQSIFAASRPLVTVREPPVYTWNEAPAGTILEQKPPAGTEISGPTTLDLVVSKGPETMKASVPDFSGMSIAQAAQAAAGSPIPVDFSMHAAKAKEKPGSVVSQEPAPGAMAGTDSRIKVSIAAPAVVPGIVNGVYVYTLQVYPYPVPVRLESIGEDGKRVGILATKHPGGVFSAPFSLKAGSTLVLSVLDREVARSEVKGK